MDAKTRIYRSSLMLALLLLVTFTHLAVEAQPAELKLIKEEQLDLDMAPGAHASAIVSFLGRPEYIRPGQAKFAPLLLINQETDQKILKVGGEAISIQGNLISYYGAEEKLLALTRQDEPPEGQSESLDEESETTFVVQKVDGSVLWQVKHAFLEDIKISSMGTVFMLCQDLVNASPGSSGVYVYDLRDGHMVTRFDDPMMKIDAYAFSGDGNRLVFEYIIYRDSPIEENLVESIVHLACMDANGQLLWDIETPDVRHMSISYQGHRVLYMTVPPNSLLEAKLGRKFHTKTGLINEEGDKLWEVDNPSALEADFIPSGDYYHMVLYGDQLSIQSPTTRQKPMYYCLFDALTHKSVWREQLDDLVPQLKEGWYTRGIGGTSLDNQWYISTFSNVMEWPRPKTVDDQIRSLIVLTELLTQKAVNQYELPGDIIKGAMSPDAKVLDILFADGRRMLFERVP